MSPGRASLPASLTALVAGAWLVAGCGRGGYPDAPPGATELRVDTATTAAEVAPEFLSFAVDSSQLAGGNWWSSEGYTEPVEPYDFARPRLRRMAAALAPAYLRLGGSEADVIYYDLSADPVSEAPPPYELVLDRTLLDGACDFARDLGLEIMFTLNAGPGPRDAELAWTPDNARGLIDYVRRTGCPVRIWELGNEINGFQAIHGTDFRIEGDRYALDMATARALVDELAPQALLAGPSSAYWPLWGEMFPVLPDFMAAGGALVDVVTWHYYPQQSDRCPLASRRADPTLLLEPENLAEVELWAAEVEAARDAHAPAAEVWLGETGNAQCGGQVGVSDRFVAGFWWLDQLGRMARRGQRVVVRQTLSGADYQLIDETTLEPKPDYFLSLLFKRLMGEGVLAVDGPDAAGQIRAYAHCAAAAAGLPAGAVTVMALNLDQRHPRVLTFSGLRGERRRVYLIEAPELLGSDVTLNGQPLQVAPDGTPPEPEPESVHQDNARAWIELPPAGMAFVVFPDAGAPACR